MKEIQNAAGEFGLRENPDPSGTAGDGQGARRADKSGRDGTADLKSFTDEDLIGRLSQNQDEDAFNELVERYADKIFRLALRITLDPGDAEEVLQEAFLKIEKPDTFRRDAKFSTWFYRIALNLCFARLRAEKKHRADVSLEGYMPYMEHGVLEGIESKSWSMRPDDALLRREGMQIIEKAVNELPAQYRAVLQLRDVEGFTNKEVAGMLNLTLPNVKSRIHRARLFMRDSLSDYFYEAGG